VVGVGQGFWLSLVARHEDLPWGMIICVVKLYKSSTIFNCLIRFSSVLFFTLALTGKTRFGWALATPLFTCHILEHNIILWSAYSIPNSPTQISPRSLCHLGTFAIFFNLVKFKGGLFNVLSSPYAIFFNSTLAVISFPPHYRPIEKLRNTTYGLLYRHLIC
jgi:hypothetical protein